MDLGSYIRSGRSVLLIRPGYIPTLKPILFHNIEGTNYSVYFYPNTTGTFFGSKEDGKKEKIKKDIEGRGIFLVTRRAIRMLISMEGNKGNFLTEIDINRN
uniref:Uncharacterized protein n=1 Tax=Heterorhabditis bacteriophora TaxID=37862 RepID=A0A1I7WHN2_HETBA